MTDQWKSESPDFLLHNPKGAQVDDVAHGGHAANAQMGQVHLVF